MGARIMIVEDEEPLALLVGQHLVEGWGQTWLGN